MPSFDTVCEPNLPEVKNAVENTAKEIATRFDFKGTSAGVELKDKEITLFGDAEFDLLTAALASAANWTDEDEAEAEADELIRLFGGNGVRLKIESY